MSHIETRTILTMAGRCVINHIYFSLVALNSHTSITIVRTEIQVWRQINNKFLKTKNFRKTCQF